MTWESTLVTRGKAGSSVSVLMTAFNERTHIVEAVESIRSQTLEDFQFVIVDDGSTDGTTQILEDFARKDSRIHLRKNGINLGRPRSLNVGLQLCRGDIVAQMDANDVAVSERLSIQVARMNDDPSVQVVGSYATLISESSAVLGERRVPVAHADIVKQLWANPVIHSSVCYRRDTVIAYGGYDETRRYLEDYELWFRCAQHGSRFANVCQPLVSYRIERRQASKRKRWRWCWSLVSTGWRGSANMGYGPKAYVGILYSAMKARAPRTMERIFGSWALAMDPRQDTLE